MLVVPYTSYSRRQARLLAPLHPQYARMDNKHSYSRLLGDLWRGGETFILVEHDIYPTPAAVSELTSCSQPYCAFPYWCRGSLEMCLGCTKFGEDLIARIPDMPIWINRYPWWSLDGRVAEAIFVMTGIRAPHQHRPPVEHRERRRDALGDRH